MVDRGDDGRADNIRGADREQALRDQAHDRLETVGLELVKGTTLLSSGALLAMLGFTQALVKTTQWPCYKSYAIWALAEFFIGALGGSASLACRSQSLIFELAGNERKAEWWFRAMYLPIGISLGALICGAVCAGYGIYKVF